MRRLAVLPLVGMLVFFGCASDKAVTDASSSTTTTINAALAAWLNTLTPPLRTFSDIQTEFVTAQQGGELAAVKLAAQHVADAARALSVAMKAAAGVPEDSAPAIQSAEGLLDQLGPLGAAVQSCIEIRSCRNPLGEFTTTFTDAVTATNGIVADARPRPTAPPTSAPGTTAAGAAAASTSSTSTTAQARVVKDGALLAWIKAYGNDLPNAVKAQGRVASALAASDPSVPETACVAYVSSVDVVSSDPLPPNSAVAAAVKDALTHTEGSYAVCSEDPAIRSGEAEQAVRSDLFALGEAIKAYLYLVG
jgi:hypothetical protein